MSEDSDITF